MLSLSILKAKKADKAEVLSRVKLQEAIDACRKRESDIYGKAAVLLKELVQKHPFASGNRRTSFVVAKEFVLSNGGKFNIKDDPSHANVMKGVRERYYTDDELAEWIKNGKIREFKR